MTVYVDKMIDYGKKIGNAGPKWCHLTADTPEELHQMAQAIGLKRSYCSDRTQPKSSVLHYDIGTEKVRNKALKLGAVEVDISPVIMRRFEERKARTAGTDACCETS